MKLDGFSQRAFDLARLFSQPLSVAHVLARRRNEQVADDRLDRLVLVSRRLCRLYTEPEGENLREGKREDNLQIT